MDISLTRYPVIPVFKEYSPDFNLTIDAPGSKSITNRALLMAALSNGRTVLEGALFSDDSRHFIQCLIDLGFKVDADESAHRIIIEGTCGRIPRKEASIYVGSAGTAARFLTAMLGLSAGTYHLDASAQMRKRPMAPLLQTLIALGCQITFDGEPGFFPFTIHSSGITASETIVDINASSQFLSALMMSAVIFEHDFTIRITGTHGLSYIQMTMKMMQQFGADITTADNCTYTIRGDSHYEACTYQIEPDASAAAYFYAMAALSGGQVLVRHIHCQSPNSLQGDVAFIHTLEAMGCTVTDTAEGTLVHGPVNEKLHGIDADLSAFSDQALTLACVAPFADTPTIIHGIGHIRFQESDRMAVIVSELDRAGIRAEITGQDITIYPGQPHSADIQTYDDHRVAMAFSLLGLKADGITICDPLCCRKTFENYFDILTEICSSCLR